MTDSHYSLTDLYLPERKKLTSFLKALSKYITFAILFICLGLIFQDILAGALINSPLMILAFILSSASLLSDKLAAIICGTMVFLIGVLLIPGTLSLGLCLSLIGLALILPRFKINHRFRPSQLIILLVLIINSTSILGYVYQSLSNFPSVLMSNPAYISAVFVLLCIASAFRWPGRGFLGVFTTDTVSSMFSLRLLLINISVISLLGLLTLVGVEYKIYNPRDAIALFVVSITVLSAALSWLNIKLLYKFELERFVMKEELKIHNIGLKLGNEDLTEKMSELKEANKEYVGKLKYRDIITNLD